jgi:hypothetical protein
MPEKTVYVPKQTARKINDILDSTSEEVFTKYGLQDGVAYTESVEFPHTYIMDIELIVAPGGLKQWARAVLYNLDADDQLVDESNWEEDFFKSWTLEGIEGEHYTVNVKVRT